MLNQYIPISSVSEIPARQICCVRKSRPPSKYLVYIQQELVFMFLKGFPKTTRLFPDIRGINIIENREHDLPKSSPTLHDLHQLLEAPTRICVASREDDDGDSRPLNRLHKLFCYILASSQRIVVDEGVDSGIDQCGVEVASEGLASVFASET